MRLRLRLHGHVCIHGQTCGVCACVRTAVPGHAMPRHVSHLLSGPCLAAAKLSLVDWQGVLNYIYIFNAISDCTVDAPANADAPAVKCDLKDTKLTLFMLISERALRGGRLMG
jgi:hypothetical protein